MRLFGRPSHTSTKGPETSRIDVATINLIRIQFQPRTVQPSASKCGKNPPLLVSFHISHALATQIKFKIHPFIGVKIRGHIRGCLDDILHNGFNQTIVAWYRWLHRDSCHKYRKRDLFMLPHDQSDDSLIHVCTCYADHCNTAGSPSIGAPILSLLFVVAYSIFGRVFLQ